MSSFEISLLKSKKFKNKVYWFNIFQQGQWRHNKRNRTHFRREKIRGSRHFVSHQSAKLHGSLHYRRSVDSLYCISQELLLQLVYWSLHYRRSVTSNTQELLILGFMMYKQYTIWFTACLKRNDFFIFKTTVFNPFFYKNI